MGPPSRFRPFRDLTPTPGPFIPDHGGYQNLLSFQKARIVYDGTVRFCEQFLSRRDRTFDQMVQAARSGKQNIVEGSLASGTSKETEIKLTNVARASLEELLENYRDFLRVRGIPEWTKESPYTQRLRQLTRTFHSLAGCEVSGLWENRAIATGWDGDARSKTPFFEITNCWPRFQCRKPIGDPYFRARFSFEPAYFAHAREICRLNRQPGADYDTFKRGIEHPDPAIAANVMIGLIKLTNYLLDRQIRHLEQAFVREGGLRERMTRARIEARGKGGRR